MFQLASPNTIYKRKVVVDVPDPDGGLSQSAFIIHFTYEPIELSEDSTLTAQDVLRDRVHGWDEVLDHKGKPVPFNAKNFDKLAKINYWFTAVWDEYQRFVSGLAEKNFETSLDG